MIKDRGLRMKRTIHFPHGHFFSRAFAGILVASIVLVACAKENTGLKMVRGTQSYNVPSTPQSLPNQRVRLVRAYDESVIDPECAERVAGKVANTAATEAELAPVRGAIVAECSQRPIQGQGFKNLYAFLALYYWDKWYGNYNGANNNSCVYSLGWWARSFGVDCWNYFYGYPYSYYQQNNHAYNPYCTNYCSFNYTTWSSQCYQCVQ